MNDSIILYRWIWYPSLNLPPITFDFRPLPHKRAHYTADLPPAAISIASENDFITLTTPSESPDLLPSDDPNTLHVMKNFVPLLGRVKRWYFCRKHDTDMLQNTRFYCSMCSDKNKNFYYCHGFSGLIQRHGLDYWNISSICQKISVDCCICLPSTLYFTCWNCFVIVFFLFHLSLPVIYHMSALIEILILYCYCWLFKFIWQHTGHTSNIYWPSSYL